MAAWCPGRRGDGGERGAGPESNDLTAAGYQAGRRLCAFVRQHRACGRIWNQVSGRGRDTVIDSFCDGGHGARVVVAASDASVWLRDPARAVAYPALTAPDTADPVTIHLKPVGFVPT